jgi:hypothetical protein
MLIFADRGSVDMTKVIRKPIHLARDLWIGPLEDDLTQAVLHATEPAAENFDPSRQYGSRYSFYRVNAPAVDHLYSWDPDRELSTALQLSRLVHPTSAALGHAARVLTREDGVRQIIPADVKGCGAQAYVVDQKHDWLTVDHALELRTLLAAFSPDQLPERVSSALFYFESAAYNYYLELRWALLTIAFESLLHIDRAPHPSQPKRFAGSTQQFVGRALALNQYLPLQFDEHELRDAYSHRSSIAHGQPINALGASELKLYARMENALRAILKEAILKPTFASMFATDASVSKFLPL